jgi:hypothetical protein
MAAIEVRVDATDRSVEASPLATTADTLQHSQDHHFSYARANQVGEFE